MCIYIYIPPLYIQSHKQIRKHRRKMLLKCDPSTIHWINLSPKLLSMQWWHRFDKDPTAEAITGSYLDFSKDRKAKMIEANFSFGISKPHLQSAVANRRRSQRLVS